MPRRKKLQAPLGSLLDLLSAMQTRKLYVVQQYWLPFGPERAFAWEDNQRPPQEVVSYGGQEGFLDILPSVGPDGGPAGRLEIVVTAKGAELMHEHRPGGIVPDYQI